MKSVLLRPRLWIALLLGVAAAFTVYHWPVSPRATLDCEHTCWDLAFSPDGTKLAALDREAGLGEPAKIRLWDVANGTLLHRIDLGKRHNPTKVVFAPDSRSVGVLDFDAVTIFDAKTGKQLAHHTHPWFPLDPDHSGGREVLFSANGDWLYHHAGEGRVYDVKTGRVVIDYDQRWPDRNNQVHGGCIAALVGGKVKTFDVLTGAEIATFESVPLQKTIKDTALYFSPDGRRAVYFSNAMQLVCHDSVQGSEFAIPLDPDDAIFADGINVSEHGLAICMGRERDLLGKWLPEMFGRHAVYVFDVASGAELGRPFRKGVRSCFAPDGKTLALTDRNSHVTLWDWPPRSRWPICILAGLSVIGVSLAVSTWHARRRKNRQPAFATAGLADNR